MPLGQMPALEIDGEKMGQSVAIARFLAKRFNLAGKTDIDQYRADMFTDTIDDIGRKYPWTEQDETKKVRVLWKCSRTNSALDVVYRGPHRGGTRATAGDAVGHLKAFYSVTVGEQRNISFDIMQ